MTRTAVLVATSRYADVLEEAGIGPTGHEYHTDAEGIWPGFNGNAATLARFILAAQALLGPHDAALLAVQVREHTHPTAVTEHLYYFPGLELY